MSSALFSAVKHGDLEKVRYLVRVQPPFQSPYSGLLLTLLILAKFLMQHDDHVHHCMQVEVEGVCVDQKDSWDATPLFYAALTGNTAMTVFLLDHGARCEEKVPAVPVTSIKSSMVVLRTRKCCERKHEANEQHGANCLAQGWLLSTQLHLWKVWGGLANGCVYVSVWVITL
jgi:hypothetical protein